jgi:hypothetical protein
MKRLTQSLPPVLLVLAALSVAAPSALARVESEVGTIEKRKAVVEKAAFYAKRVKAPALAANLPLPFAPPNFDLTDAEEAEAAAAAARLANPNKPVVSAPTDHQLLSEIVAKVRPSGTAYLAGHPMLMFGNRFVKTGAHFTVSYKGTDYDLELTQIDGSNFTLRYKSDEITRPIQAAQPKSP